MTKHEDGRAVPDKKKCPFCKGDGMVLADELIRCKICKGTGFV